VLHKTRGVVFRFTRYGDTSIIASIFTEQFGLQSYIVNGIRSKNSKSKIALYQPLTLLELVVYHKEHANINRIKEVKCFHPYATIPHDVIKSSVAMFIHEVLNKTVKEESHAHALCEFIISSLISLDTITGQVENFHIIFLLKLSRFLGFGAHAAEEILKWRITDPLIERCMEDLIRADYTTEIRLTGQDRREVLDLVLKFFYEHSGMTGEIKSLPVLREILR
jgi:DNA repair protein RecO (recombination protein O)